jgi:hypothetical protein
MDALIAVLISFALILQVWLFSRWLKRQASLHDLRVANILKLIGNEGKGKRLIIGASFYGARRKWAVRFNVLWTVFSAFMLFISLGHSAAELVSLFIPMVGLLMFWPMAHWYLKKEKLFVLTQTGVEEWPKIDDPVPKVTLWSQINRLHIEEGSENAPPIIVAWTTAGRLKVRSRSYDEFDNALDLFVSNVPIECMDKSVRRAVKYRIKRQHA